MKKLFAFLLVFVAHNGIAFPKPNSDLSMDLKNLSVMKQALSYVTPSNEVITTWLKVIKDPYIKLQALKTLQPYMTNLSRNDYFHISLLPMSNDTDRLIFLKAHEYSNISAQEVAKIVGNLSSKYAKIEGISIIIDRMDELSKSTVSNDIDPIINIFKTIMMKEKIKELLANI